MSLAIDFHFSSFSFLYAKVAIYSPFFFFFFKIQTKCFSFSFILFTSHLMHKHIAHHIFLSFFFWAEVTLNRTASLVCVRVFQYFGRAQKKNKNKKRLKDVNGVGHPFVVVDWSFAV